MTIDWNHDLIICSNIRPTPYLQFLQAFNETIGFYIGKEYVYIDVNIPKIAMKKRKVES